MVAFSKLIKDIPSGENFHATPDLINFKIIACAHRKRKKHAFRNVKISKTGGIKANDIEKCYANTNRASR